MKFILVSAGILLIAAIVFLTQRERTAAANTELARDVMYCGAFKLFVLQHQHQGNAEAFKMDPDVVYLRFLLAFASTGLGKGDLKPMGLEAHGRLMKDLRDGADRMAQDPNALRYFLKGTRARCDTLLRTPAVRSAAERGEAMLTAAHEKAKAKAKKKTPPEAKKP